MQAAGRRQAESGEAKWGICLRKIIYTFLKVHIRDLAQKPHEPHAAFGHCAKFPGFDGFVFGPGWFPHAALRNAQKPHAACAAFAQGLYCSLNKFDNKWLSLDLGRAIPDGSKFTFWRNKFMNPYRVESGQNGNSKYYATAILPAVAHDLPVPKSNDFQYKYSFDQAWDGAQGLNICLEDVELDTRRLSREAENSIWRLR
ncbi:hypothetical protein DFH08DRAFT_945008 [Mycena albidolilacea]|uniref:Uncharacterized protein n=1 Tax=Mycena albidolilacea TaxID=1033008 RepID=A0AAD7EAI2_9AGAR|nr:hypothetical protein DFH08DRAFT_945008 [Mycena albidolilacea]